MAEIRLRKLCESDLKSLKRISKDTFTDSFSAENTPENLQSYIDKAFSDEKLKKELNDKDSEFYFAELESVVGYIKINFRQAQSDLKENNAIELERIYVLKNFQGMKIGQKMLDFAIEKGRKHKKDCLWLGVWEKNVKAINFYKKNGFEITGAHPFKLGDDLQTDYIMKRKL